MRRAQLHALRIDLIRGISPSVETIDLLFIDLENAVESANAYADRADRLGVRSSELSNAIGEHLQALKDAEKACEQALKDAEKACEHASTEKEDAEEDRDSAVNASNEAKGERDFAAEERDVAFRCRDHAQTERDELQHKLSALVTPVSLPDLNVLADLMREHAPRILGACSLPPRPRHCDACHAAYLTLALAAALAKISNQR
jgi:chromosome segregation ATPase